MVEHYELLYIVSINYTGDELQKAVESVAKLIDGNGEITKNQIIGKQKFAYPIEKIHQGTYVVVEFDFPRENLKEFEKHLQLMKEVLRFLIVRKKIKSIQEIEKEKKIQEKILKRKEDELAALDEKKSDISVSSDTVSKPDARKQLEKEKTIDVVEEADSKEALVSVSADDKAEESSESNEGNVKDENAPASEVEIKEKKAKDKVSLEDLDKKLDDILSDDIL